MCRIFSVANFFTLAAFLPFQIAADTWPRSYFDCSGTTPTGYQNSIAVGLNSNLQTLLDGANYVIYTYNNVTTAHNKVNNNNFSGDQTNQPDTGLLGFTMDPAKTDNPEPGQKMFYQSMIFLNTIGTSSQFQKEISAHELGHAINYAGGYPANSTDWQNFVLNDLQQIDYVNGVLTSPRPACGVGGALEGVLDQTGAALCANGALVKNWTGYSNSGIILINDVHIWSGLDESFAQTFAYADYANGNASTQTFAHPTTDSLFAAGKLPCMLAWGTNTATTGTVTKPTATTGPTAPPSYCVNNYNSSYVPFVTPQ